VPQEKRKEKGLDRPGFQEVQGFTSDENITSLDDMAYFALFGNAIPAH